MRKDMTNEAYHAHPAISKTSLDMIEKDPQRLQWAKKCPRDEDKLKTFDFGDAMHAICLEPDRLKREFIAAPEFNRRTKDGKLAEAEFKQQHADKKILSAEEWKKLNLMFESVMAHPEARQIIEAEGQAETSWFWTDKETGIDCKCRPDKIVGPALIDVKTTDTLEKFQYSVIDYRYYVQDPFYRDGLIACDQEAEIMKFLVIQKHIECGRYPVMVCYLPHEAVSFGRLSYRRNLDQLAEYKTNGSKTLELAMPFRFMEQALEATTEIEL